jgi:hypothetical protein
MVFASFGIGKGKLFAPDARMRRDLADAVAIADYGGYIYCFFMGSGIK